MRSKTIWLLGTLVLTILASSNLLKKEYYPDEEWEQYTNPTQIGFDTTHLNEAKKFYDSIRAASVLVLYKGRILLNWGENTRRFRAASIRKSFLNALIGIKVKEGKLHLDDTITHYSLEAFSELTPQEKKATLKDLLCSSSGIYLPAAYEADVWTKRKPLRESHLPGEYWYYNNWDFNVLGAIYNSVSSDSIAKDFKHEIAEKIGMQDFRPELDFKYFYENSIPVPAYLFKTSSRDMARFGLLYLKKGRWNNRQVLPSKWIQESTQKIKTPWEGTGYGYLWWNTTLNNDSPIYYAQGTGLQGIYVVPSKELVMVFRANTFLGPTVDDGLDLQLLNKIIASQTGEVKDEITTEPAQWPIQKLANPKIKNVNRWLGTYTNNIARQIQITKENDRLLLTTKIADFLMLPQTDSTCWVQDLNVIARLRVSAERSGTSLLGRDGLIFYK